MRWPFARRLIAAGALLLLMAGCSGLGDANGRTITAKIADKVVEVDMEHRPLRACLLSAMVVEVMTDRIQTFDGTQAAEALGRVMALQSTIDASAELLFWANTDMADSSLQLARVLGAGGQDRFRRLISGGPTLSNFLETAERAALLTVKGEAMLLDINVMLSKVKDGSLSADDAWAACEARIEQNLKVLQVLSGVGSG